MTDPNWCLLCQRHVDSPMLCKTEDCPLRDVIEAQRRLAEAIMHNPDMLRGVFKP